MARRVSCSDTGARTFSISAWAFFIPASGVYFSSKISWKVGHEDIPHLPVVVGTHLRPEHQGAGRARPAPAAAWPLYSFHDGQVEGGFAGGDVSGADVPACLDLRRSRELGKLPRRLLLLLGRLLEDVKARRRPWPPPAACAWAGRRYPTRTSPSHAQSAGSPSSGSASPCCPRRSPAPTLGKCGDAA